MKTVSREKVRDCLDKEHYADAYGLLGVHFFDCVDCDIKEARIEK